MATIGEGFKNIFLAGIGAVALTGEAAKKAVDTMIEKGEITLEQGKELNEELRRRAADGAAPVREGAMEARMSVMTPEEREEFAAKAAELAKKMNAEPVEAEVVEVGEVAEEAAEDASE